MTLSEELFIRQLRELRAENWRVAVHNDYHLDGKLYTFWLFIHPSGRWLKGESTTDAEAVDLVYQQAKKPWTASEQLQRAAELWKKNG